MKDDFIAAMKYLVELRKGRDDRRYRSPWQPPRASDRRRTCLPTNAGSALPARNGSSSERMTLFDAERGQDYAAEADQSKIAQCALSATSSDVHQLSQFMDQTNPLAELTHKRRLSALGRVV